jgi:hypothetical protein
MIMNSTIGTLAIVAVVLTAATLVGNSFGQAANNDNKTATSTSSTNTTKRR